MSRSGVFHKYDVYIDGNLVVSKATNKEASILTGCDQRLIYKYASNGHNHVKNGKTIRFVIVESSTAKGRPKSEKSIIKDKPSQMREGWDKEWDETRLKILKICGRVI